MSTKTVYDNRDLPEIGREPETFTINDIRKMIKKRMAEMGGATAYAKHLGIAKQYVSSACVDLPSISQKILDDIGIVELGMTYGYEGKPPPQRWVDIKVTKTGEKKS